MNIHLKYTSKSQILLRVNLMWSNDLPKFKQRFGFTDIIGGLKTPQYCLKIKILALFRETSSLEVQAQTSKQLFI